MKAQNNEQQAIFDSETAGLSWYPYHLSSGFIESLGFSMIRIHELKNLHGDEVELEVFENERKQRIVILCVTQFTHTEGDLLHITCYADSEYATVLENEHLKYRKN